MMRLCAVDLTFPTTSVFFPMGASFVEESYVTSPACHHHGYCILHLLP